MNWGLLVYSMTVDGFGIALYPFLEQSAVQANSVFGWYASLIALFFFMVGGVVLTVGGLVMKGSVTLGPAKALLGMSSLLGLVLLVGVLWSEAIYSDRLAACPSTGQQAGNEQREENDFAV